MGNQSPPEKIYLGEVGTTQSGRPEGAGNRGKAEKNRSEPEKNRVWIQTGW
jgi:hypothetical protein